MYFGLSVLTVLEELLEVRNFRTQGSTFKRNVSPPDQHNFTSPIERLLDAFFPALHLKKRKHGFL